MHGFEYPPRPHVRRHGPAGYLEYESYRDWLRDEFAFRCVYCLHRERWYGRGVTFNIDHLVPVAADPSGELDYANLLYACATCNNAKRNVLGVPDPCSIAFADCVSVMEDGQVRALNQSGELLIKKSRLNSPANVRYRSQWIRALSALQVHEPDLYRDFMAFPDELPDLRAKRVPLNSRPDSVGSCYFALRERGELPPTY